MNKILDTKYYIGSLTVIFVAYYLLFSFWVKTDIYLSLSYLNVLYSKLLLLFIVYLLLTVIIFLRMSKGSKRVFLIFLSWFSFIFQEDWILILKVNLGSMGFYETVHISLAWISQIGLVFGLIYLIFHKPN